MKKNWTRDNSIAFIIHHSRAVLYVLAAGMLLWLCANAFVVSGKQWYQGVNGLEMLGIRMLAVLCALAVSVLAGGFMDRLMDKYARAEWVLLGICSALFWGICLWWVSVVPYAMEGDQAIVWYNSVLALQKDFTMYGYGGQMFIYPQQQGLSFLYEILFRVTGSTSARMIGYINASLAPVTLFFGYQCVKICGNRAAAVRFLPMLMLCLPYIIYSPYVYGDIPSIALTFVLLWAVLKALETQKRGFGVLAMAAAALALMCRMNMWIFFIGMMIGLCYYGLHIRSIKPVLFALGIVLCAFLAMSGIKQFNSFRSGEPVSKGMPSVLWMAMGVQFSEEGAGYYNNYSKGIFEQVGFDRAQASAIGIQEIKDRCRVFAQYPDQAGMFFEQKLFIQWLDCLFESMKFTGTFGLAEGENAAPLVESVYYGEGHTMVRRFSGHMLAIVYGFAFAGVILRFFEKRTILEDIPLIVFVGGFLFSIIWEAKARYMLPYFVLLHMYAAYGMAGLSTKIKRKLNNFLWKVR